MGFLEVMVEVKVDVNDVFVEAEVIDDFSK
jgi:hypothetical protein